MNGRRVCQSYEVIDSRRMGDTEVVLGYSPTEVSPYVTWKCYACDNFQGYDYSRYFGDEQAIRKNMKQQVDELREELPPGHLDWKPRRYRKDPGMERQRTMSGVFFLFRSPLNLMGPSRKMRKIDFQECVERMRTLTDQLEAGTTGLLQSGQYAAYLQSFSRLHHYSYGNIFLTRLQRLHTSIVVGYGDRKRKFGHHVKTGETDITVLAPCPYWAQDEVEETGPDGQITKKQKWVKKTGFTTATVFDVSQTEGQELPSPNVESLTGTVEGYEKLLSTLRSTSPVLAGEDPLPPDVHEAYYYVERKTTLNPGMSKAQAIKTLAHEIAHAKPHALPMEGGTVVGAHEKDRRIHEVGVESMTYTVCQYLGPNIRDYSPGYTTGWSSGRERMELHASLECIRSTAAELIDGVESRCLDRPSPEPVPRSQERRIKGRKKRAQASKVLSI